MPMVAVGIQANTTGFKANTMVPLSISFWIKKKQIPNSSPINIRVPAPEERNEPSTKGMASNTENPIATNDRRD